MFNKLDFVWAHQLPKKGHCHASNYPRISNVHITSAGLVTWDTDIPSTSQVHFGLTPNLGPYSPYDATLVTSHTVQLTGLLLNRLYFLRVQSFYLDSLSISDLYTFNTGFDIRNVTPDFAFDASDTSLDELANVTGTMITLFLTGTTLTNTFTVTNVTTTHTCDAEDTSLDGLANVLGSLINSLSATGISSDVYTFTNVSSIFALDALNTSENDLASILGNVIVFLRSSGALA